MTTNEQRAGIKRQLDELITEAWRRLGSYPCEAEWCAAEGTERTESSERYCPDHYRMLS